jgi:hypothetical protein
MKTIVIALLAYLLPVLSFAAPDDGAILLVPPSEKVASRSQADWSRAWWEWAGSFAEYESPIADKKGTRCQLKQSGPVWFLAGTYGTQRTIRTCTVPAGKHLFFPLINYVVMPQYRGSMTCEYAKAMALNMTEDVSSLVLELDGKQMKNLNAHRQATKDCFDLAALAGGGVAPSAANGYYVMLRPLSRGTHTLNFGGILPDMSQAVTYTLYVE